MREPLKGDAVIKRKSDALRSGGHRTRLSTIDQGSAACGRGTVASVLCHLSGGHTAGRRMLEVSIDMWTYAYATATYMTSMHADTQMAMIQIATYNEEVITAKPSDALAARRPS